MTPEQLERAKSAVSSWYADKQRGDETVITNAAILLLAELITDYETRDPDGWIDWSGNGCPVDGCEYVDVVLAHGELFTQFQAQTLRWTVSGGDGDIVKYRIHHFKRGQ